MTKLMFVIANEPRRPGTALRRDPPSCIDQVVDRASAKDPAVRFGSVAEMAAAMRSVAGRF